MAPFREEIRFNKYPSYINSNVLWIECIPNHWILTRLGTKFEERRSKVSDKDFPPLSVTKQGILPQLENAAKTNDGDNRKLVKAGDFVINSRSDRKGSSGISDIDGSVSLINIVLIPKNIKSTFIHYLLKSHSFVEEFYRMGHGIVADLWTTRFDEMKIITIAVPPIDEQEAISLFLERKLFQINTAISFKEKQIELLKEHLLIRVTESVTVGLNPHIKMKQSNINWLEQIPSHWEVDKLGAILELKSDKNHPDYEVLSVYREYGVIKKDSRDDNHNVTSDDRTNYKAVQPGDLVVNKMKAWQGSMGISAYKGIVSPAYITCKVKYDKYESKYLHFLLRSYLLIGEYNRISYGVRIGQWDMHYEDFKKVPVIIPPKSEQKLIIDFIDRLKNKVEIAISLKEKEIENLKEYRSSLINSVVTGKIKVT